MFNLVVKQNLATGSDDTTEVKMEQQRERLLFGQVLVQIALQVLYFDKHTLVGGQEHVRVSSEKVAQVCCVSAGRIDLYQIKFLLDKVASVLQTQLWERIEHLHDFLGFNFVVCAQECEEAFKVRYFGRKHSA